MLASTLVDFTITIAYVHASTYKIIYREKYVQTEIELDTVIDELGSLGLWTPRQLVNEPTLQAMDKFIQESP